MQKSCRRNCPVQLACSNLVAKNNEQRDLAYSLHLETLDRLSVETDERQKNLYQGLHNLHLEASELFENSDDRVKELEMHARKAGNFCIGPLRMRRYLFFGRDVVRCSSPLALGLPKSADDAAAEAFFARVEDC